MGPGEAEGLRADTETCIPSWLTGRGSGATEQLWGALGKGFLSLSLGFLLRRTETRALHKDV